MIICSLCKLNLNNTKILFYCDNSYCYLCCPWSNNHLNNYISKKIKIEKNIIKKKKKLQRNLFIIGIIYISIKYYNLSKVKDQSLKLLTLMN